MTYTCNYASPLGTIFLAAEENGLVGLWLEGQKYSAKSALQSQEEPSFPVLKDASRWLDIYFSGKEPDFLPPVRFSGSPFQNEVWKLLTGIPYGQTTTYGALAKALAAKRGIPRMSAQAVGGAVGHNPISIIVPCHRVVGTNGNLTGYAGGIDKKVFLLRLEHALKPEFFIPKTGTAL